MTAAVEADLPAQGYRAAEYDARDVVRFLMTHLVKERIPVEIDSANRAYEAAGLLLEALGIESTWPEPLPSNVVPFQRRAVRL